MIAPSSNARLPIWVIRVVFKSANDFRSTPLNGHRRIRLTRLKSAKNGRLTILFDHLVRGKQQLQGNLQTKCVCGLAVYHELILGRLLIRQIARLFAAQDAVDVGSGAAEYFDAIRS